MKIQILDQLEWASQYEFHAIFTHGRVDVEFGIKKRRFLVWSHASHPYILN